MFCHCSCVHFFGTYFCSLRYHILSALDKMEVCQSPSVTPTPTYPPSICPSFPLNPSLFFCDPSVSGSIGGSESCVCHLSVCVHEAQIFMQPLRIVQQQMMSSSHRLPVSIATSIQPLLSLTQTDGREGW